MAYEKGQILGNLEVKYDVGQQIDERTYYVRVCDQKMEGYEYEGTVQLYYDHEEAVRVFNMSKHINDPSVVRAKLINKQENGITTILFEKFYEKDFSGWLNDLACPWEQNDSGVVLSANKQFTDTFKGIARGLRLLIKSNHYHGRLFGGVRVSRDNSVQLVNFTRKESNERGIRDDIQDLKNLVREVQRRHQIQWVALELFYSLESVYYTKGLSLRSYAIYMYTNALFCDEDGRYDLMKKLIKLRKMNAFEFDQMILDILPTDVRHWRALVNTTPGLSAVYHFEHNPDDKTKKKATKKPKKYTSNGSIVLFFDNCHKHLEVDGVAHTPFARQLYLHELYPDVIYKLVFAFARDIGILGSFNGIDMGDYFDTDASSSSQI